MKSVLYDLTPACNSDGKKFELYVIDKTFWDSNKISEFYESSELEETIDILSSKFDNAKRIDLNRIQINGPKSNILHVLVNCKENGLELLYSSDISRYRHFVE